MQMCFHPDRIKTDCFVKNIYQFFINEGFSFTQGSTAEGDSSIRIIPSFDEVCDYNQARLEKRLSEGFPKIEREEGVVYEGELGYRHIYFEREGFLEIHGFWSDSAGYPVFYLDVPEDDVMFRKETPKHKYDKFYKQDKIQPLKNSALKMWEQRKVDAVQTTHDMDDPWYTLFDVVSGRGIIYNPFAILPESIYEKYPKDYFTSDYFKYAQAVNIGNNGVYIEQSERIM
jgi:hypothetical protein